MTPALKFIHDYLQISEKQLKKLRTAVGHEDLMRAWRSGLLEKSGVIAGISYEFHGSGIYLETDGLEVEIDFVKDCSKRVFDSWRLWQWAKKRSKDYPLISSHQSVKNILQKLSEENIIVQAEREGFYHLIDQGMDCP